MKYWFRGIKLLLLSLCTLILVVACNSSTPQLQSSETPENVASNCRVIQHDGGEINICGQPQKVVALSPPLLDILLSLGVQPAGYAEVDLLNSKVFDNPSQQIPFLGDRVTSKPVNLGDRHNPSIETLVQLKPDLILGEKFQLESKYRLFSSIAPTAFFDTGGKTGWKSAMEAIAQGLNREAQAKQAIASHDQLLETVKSQLAPVISGQTIIVLGWQKVTNESFIFAPDFVTGLLEDLGFQVIVGKSNRPSVSIEAIANIKADHILVMPSGDNTIEDAKQQWQNHPILRLIPAVQAEKIYFMDYQLTRIRGPIAAEIFINQIRQLLQS
ncbi:iron-siderophore ABC transporter substrate-binding protein [Cronbergia sp. UHCC 0137]|uniref:ABC transporter substrate-binding protein n=1 Tax=Cronbergia sp. UHCC 0137 TaxID=3110239 RepID=UPI002B1F596D|nr:iron-siderophore ABC transporter substrate-binding protein [Cronbergia sp. UHCC 0137]MEA5617131.1 iron-siderophore ABC transporter substrate-binding protein [Cronbergia sp. UHCC 0137]